MDAHLTLKTESDLKLLISEKQILDKIAHVAKSLDAHFEDTPLTIVMIMKGALCLVADLIRHLHMPCSLEFIQGCSYGQNGTERGALSLFGLEQIDISGKHVLVVDDIFDSGVTLSEVVRLLSLQNPLSIQSLVLLSKQVPKKTAYVPNYVLFTIEDLFVVGYGLDYKELYRGLPGIYLYQ
jgi:hypoxanthine phosphoribosyltransferase